MWYVDDFNVAVGVLKSIPFGFAASWSLSSVPMYLLMGYFAFNSGMAERLFHTIRVWGGAGFPVPWPSPLFSVAPALGRYAGSSGATSAAFGQIAIPEMEKDNYKIELAAGCIAASGTMGSLMPPSLLMIIYAVLVEESIGRIFMAGILPCILSAVIYAAMIYFRVKLKPSLAPPLRCPQAFHVHKDGGLGQPLGCVRHNCYRGSGGYIPAFSPRPRREPVELSR